MLITGSSAAAAMAFAAGASKPATVLSPAALEALEREVSRLSAQLSSLRAKRATAQSELKALTQSLPKLASRAAKLAMEKSALAAMVEDLEVQVASAAAAAHSVSGHGGGKGKAALEEEAAERNGLAAAAQAAASRASSASVAAAAQQTLVAALKRRLVDSGGERVARVEARLARAREDFETASKELVKTRNVLKTAEKAIEKAEGAIRKAECEMASGKEEYEKSTREMAALEEDALVALQGVEVAKVHLQNREAALVEARAAAAALTAKVKISKAAKVAAEVSPIVSTARQAPPRSRGVCARAPLSHPTSKLTPPCLPPSPTTHTHVTPHHAQNSASAAANDCIKGRDAATAWATRVEKLGEEYTEHMQELCSDMEAGMRETGEIAPLEECEDSTTTVMSGGQAPFNPHPAVLAALTEPFVTPSSHPPQHF